MGLLTRGMALRRVKGVLLAVALVVVPSMPALSAGPAFELQAAKDDDRLIITVLFEAVPLGFAWDQFEQSGFPDEMIGVVPADQVGDDGRPSADAELRLVHLDRVDEGIYRGEIAIDDGDWAVVPWPLDKEFDNDGHAGVPETLLVSSDKASTVLVLVGVVALALAVSAYLVVQVRQQRWRLRPNGTGSSAD